MENQVYIFDTTLRDGQQCPGAAMSFNKNLEYARMASELGVDVLEAGFPSASKLDFEIVKEIAKEHGSTDGSMIIAGLCQLRDEQIDRTMESLLPALAKKRARLHVYVPVDPELMEASLGEKADKSKIVRDISDFIKRATGAGLSVEFSPEGYSRMRDNFSFTTDCIRAAVEAGALVINCPDTIGGSSKLQGDNYFINHMNQHAEIIKKEFPQQKVIWSMHCHNDFGLALENSLNGVFFGPATQIEGCFNGIGERSGNVALEQCIMVIKHFAKDANKPLFTNIKTEKLKDVCDFVATNMLPRQPHFPISGENSSRHSSGGHTNAVLKNPLAYQPFDPKEVGQQISIVFGPLSGGNHAKSVVESKGYKCAESEKAAVAQFIKDHYQERRKGITDDELLKGYLEFRNPIRIDEFDYSRSSNRSSVHLKGKFFDQSGEINETHEGKDSALAALKKAIDSKMPGYEIYSYRSTSNGESINALSISTIILVDQDKNSFEGVGEDADIEISAMKALISAANRTYVETNFKA
jgi:2-isopropylmalate synthase